MVNAIGLILNQTMLIERDRYLNAEPYERTGARVSSSNGFKGKTLTTRIGARKKVRDRDIRLHTMSEEGTRANDMFLSIKETARKQSIGFMAYIYDRLSGANTMPSLASLVARPRPSPAT